MRVAAQISILWVALLVGIVPAGQCVSRVLYGVCCCAMPANSTDKALGAENSVPAPARPSCCSRAEKVEPATHAIYFINSSTSPLNETQCCSQLTRHGLDGAPQIHLTLESVKATPFKEVLLPISAPQSVSSRSPDYHASPHAFDMPLFIADRTLLI